MPHDLRSDRRARANPVFRTQRVGAVKAINAALLGLRGDCSHWVTLDQVIETMRQTGVDMQSKYKESSRGGLAVNVSSAVPAGALPRANALKCVAGVQVLA